MAMPHELPPSHARGTSKNTFAKAALVLSLIGIVTCWVVIGGFFGIAAVVIGILGRSRARHMDGTGGRAATAGIVLGALAALIAFVLATGAWTFYQRHGDDVRRYQQCLRDPGREAVVCQRHFNEAVRDSGK